MAAGQHPICFQCARVGYLVGHTQRPILHCFYVYAPLPPLPLWSRHCSPPRRPLRYAHPVIITSQVTDVRRLSPISIYHPTQPRLHCSCAARRPRCRPRAAGCWRPRACAGWAKPSERLAPQSATCLQANRRRLRASAFITSSIGDLRVAVGYGGFTGVWRGRG